MNEPRMSSDASVDSADGADAKVDAGTTLDGAFGQDASEGPRGCELMGGDTHYYAIDFLDIAGPDSDDPTVVPGFDMDGIVSDGRDDSGCYHPDFRSGEPDNIDGVDSQLGKTLLTFGFKEDMTQNFAKAIRAGAFVFVLAVHGVDDLSDDDCVHVEFRLGSLPEGSSMPQLTDNGRLVSGQQIRLVAPAAVRDVPSSQALLVDGRIEGGRVRASLGGPFDVRLPLEDESSFAIREHDLHVAFDMSPSSVTRGVLGGRGNLDETIAINEAAIEQLDFDSTVLRLALAAEADLEPVNGRCMSISLSHLFEAVPIEAVP